MPPKRLQPNKPWILQEPDGPQVEPPMLTCPSCGGQIEHAAHSCPDCAAGLHQRRGAPVRAIHAAPPRRVDPAAAEFGNRMERIERWTRVACVVAGSLFTICGLWQIVFHTNVYAILGCAVLAIVCFTRGLRGGDADLHVLDNFIFWRSWRRW